MRFLTFLLPLTLLGTSILAWDQNDHEIFNLHERLRKVKGSGNHDFYTLLDVPRDASSDDISKAFRKLSLKLHPDRNVGNKKAAEEFEVVNGAVKVLREDRKRYDNHLRSGIPRWAHGGFYHQSWRPSILTVFGIILVLAGLIQYLSAWVLYIVRREEVDEGKGLRHLPAAKLAKELQKRGFEFSKKELQKQSSVDKILDEKVALKRTVVHYPKPSVDDIFLIKYPKMVFEKFNKGKGRTAGIASEGAQAEFKQSDSEVKKTN